MAPNDWTRLNKKSRSNGIASLDLKKIFLPFLPAYTLINPRSKSTGTKICKINTFGSINGSSKVLKNAIGTIKHKSIKPFRSRLSLWLNFRFLIILIN
ncbi:hypothetical protein IID62_08570 [candidate division KSB1 bacterium]|nr:hypothetical protein [candidate division KSB1 bacterium]